MTDQTPNSQPKQAPKEPYLDLSFARSTKDMARVALVVSLLALGLAVVLFLSSRGDVDNAKVSLQSVQERLETIEAQVDEKVAKASEDLQAAVAKSSEETRAEIAKARDEMAAEAKAATAQLADRVGGLEGKMDEVVKLPQEVRTRLTREMIQDLRQRSAALAAQLDSQDSQERLALIQQSLDELEQGLPGE